MADRPEAADAGAMTTLLLGWDGAGWRAALSRALSGADPSPASCLDAAAAWLLHEHGRDLGPLIVALPGARAGRGLLECLVRRGVSVPPEITTVGHLTDRLLLLERPSAGRLARTLVWSTVLREAASSVLTPVVREPPAADDVPGWWALAEELRTLHGEIAAEGLAFDDVRAAVERHERARGGSGARGPGRETARWKALAALQSGYRARLLAQGLGDPHELRREALAAGRLSCPSPVVLVGVVELSGLARGLVQRLGSAATALVFAPPERAGDFDDFGCVRPERWTDAPLALTDAQLQVVGRPDEQARAARDALAALDGRYPADAITIGVPDDEVVPWIEHRLLREGVATRRAAGTPVSRTATARLLEAAAALLAGRRVRDLSAFVRHPHVRDWLLRRAAEDGREPRDAAALLDAYHKRHLPDRVPERWLGRAARREEREALEALRADVRALLGELHTREARPLPAWTGPLRALLLRAQGEAAIDRETQGGHEAAKVLESLDEALREFDALPPTLAAAAPLDAPAALHLLLRATAGAVVPPRRQAGAVELLGWLELALDDAPVLVLTGMNEGRVPEPVRGVASLPDALRAELHLPDDAQRHARDAWALELMCRTRASLTVIAGRRGLDDEPLLPSRLLFHADPETVVGRVQRVLADEPAPDARLVDEDTPDGAASQPAPAAPPAAPPPRRVALGPVPPIESVSVTGFRTYLKSPYLYYLQRLLGLEQADDTARELDALEFGTLAHEVLAAFGEDAHVRDATDAKTIVAALDEALARLVAERFGARPLPAVTLQVEQLRLRLHAFAAWQATRAESGWRIAKCEWAPDEPVQLLAESGPVVLRGRIDRIDVHLDKRRWALLDYKTGNDPTPPGREHRKQDGEWKDLQLPLYELLARPFAAEHEFEQPPALGYIVLPRNTSDTGILLADWTAEFLEEAQQEALRLVDAMRSEGFERLGDFPEQDPQLAALAGIGLLTEPDEEAAVGAEGGS
jgi:RecB family exonuclease